MSKPIIGSRYTPNWFERRFRDGSFCAFKPSMTDDELMLQRALLHRTNRRAQCLPVTYKEKNNGPQPQ